MSKPKLSVRGLANIHVLLAKADQPAPEPAKPTTTREAIIQRTVERLVTSADYSGQDAYASAESRARKLVTAAVRDAWEAGHLASLAQNAAVDAIVKQQYETRTSHAVPAVVASVMEHLGRDTFMLDLHMVASVFERNTLEFSVIEVDNKHVVDYTLVARDDAAPFVPPTLEDTIKRLEGVEYSSARKAFGLPIPKKPRAPRKPKVAPETDALDDEAPAKKPRAPRKAKALPPVNVDPADLL